MTPLNILGLFITFAFFTACFLNYVSSYPIAFVDEGISRKEWENKRSDNITLTFICMLVSATLTTLTSF